MPPPAQTQLQLMLFALSSGKRPMRCRQARGRQRRPEASKVIWAAPDLPFALAPPMRSSMTGRVRVRCDWSDNALPYMVLVVGTSWTGRWKTLDRSGIRAYLRTHMRGHSSLGSIHRGVFGLLGDRLGVRPIDKKPSQPPWLRQRKRAYCTMLQVPCTTHPAGFFPSRRSLSVVASRCSSTLFPRNSLRR